MPQTIPATVDFHGARLIVAHIDGIPYIAIKPICEALTVDWSAQFRRIQRHAVLSEGVAVMAIPSNGGTQDFVCLPLDKLNGWLFGITASRVKDPARRERLIQYQRECFDVLAAHFGAAAKAAARVDPVETLNTTIARLTQQVASYPLELFEPLVRAVLLRRRRLRQQQARRQQGLEQTFEQAEIEYAPVPTKAPTRLSAPKAKTKGQAIPVETVVLAAASFAGRLQAEIARALLSSQVDSYQSDRFLITLTSYDERGWQPYIEKLDPGALCVSWDKLVHRLAEPGGVRPSDAQLASMQRTLADIALQRAQARSSQRLSAPQGVQP